MVDIDGLLMFGDFLFFEEVGQLASCRRKEALAEGRPDMEKFVRERLELIEIKTERMLVPAAWS